jgi:predicted membrane protein
MKRHFVDAAIVIVIAVCGFMAFYLSDQKPKLSLCITSGALLIVFLRGRIANRILTPVASIYFFTSVLLYGYFFIWK